MVLNFLAVGTGLEPVLGTRYDAISGAVLFPYAYSITHSRVGIPIPPPDRVKMERVLLNLSIQIWVHYEFHLLL